MTLIQNNLQLYPRSVSVFIAQSRSWAGQDGSESEKMYWVWVWFFVPREKVLVNRVSYDSPLNLTPLYTAPDTFLLVIYRHSNWRGYKWTFYSSWWIPKILMKHSISDLWSFETQLSPQSSPQSTPGRTMSEHGFLKPNPVLFDLERLKPRAQLVHELGQGAPCGQCGHKCSGFELHFWKKVCQNCRCGKIEHGVMDREDPGQFFVGKIFDRYAYCIIV